ncbi:unnamed protein product [Somion occarium]|uniref:Uncharacterized protein n=1 Tax=Somion occarium TaxID=3059160 RepID=A0ABP1CT66_9APHY
MEPTVANRDFMFAGPPLLVKPFVSRVLEKLRRTDVDADFANEYVHCLRNTWLRQGNILRGQGFTDLQRTFVECGVVETFLYFTQNPRSTSDLAIATYLAMDTFQYLVRAANLDQRRKLHDQLMQHSALEIAIDKVDNHELCLHRTVGKGTIRILSQALFLGETMSSRRAADLIEKLCKWTLEGPDRDSQELLEPDKTWQSQMMVGLFNMPGSVFPLDGVPGFQVPLEGKQKDDYEAEYDATIETIEIVISSPDWSRKLVDVWTKLENEKPSDIKRVFGKVATDYYAVEPSEESTLRSAFSYRGHVRLGILRLIASSTYVDTVKDTDLLSFLRVAYLGSQKFKSPAEIERSGQPSDRHVWVERNEEISRVPFWAAEIGATVDFVAFIARESVTGPIAFVRLFTKLIERGLLEQSQSWTTLPEGILPSTTLKQVKQILSPEIVKKVLSLAMKRITAYREVGRDFVQMEKNNRIAYLVYLHGAELGWDLLELNRTSGGKYTTDIRGARKELVLCLGNAAEMCIRLSKFRRALVSATAVNQVIQDASQDEGITTDLAEKNKRRLAEAKRKIDELGI